MALGLMVYREPPFTVLQVDGDLEMSSVPKFRQAIIDTLAEGDTQIVVDLSGSDFVDSTGLGALIGGLKRARSADGSLDVVCAQPRLRQLFQLTDLDKIFSLHESMPDHIAANTAAANTAAANTAAANTAAANTAAASGAEPQP